jgi:hypothetical protein
MTAPLFINGIELKLTITAESLFLANVEPLDLSDDEALSAVSQSLTQFGCDADRCAAEVWGEIADHPDCGYSRWNRCVTRAARLLAVEA